MYFSMLSLVSWTDISPVTMCNLSRTRIIEYVAHILQLINNLSKGNLNARYFILRFMTERNGHHRYAGKNAQSRNVSKDLLLVHNIHKEHYIQNSM